jgi:hypothetical protein
MTRYATFRFSPAERRNWGYWDGVTARQRGRLPEWSRAGTISRHPFDKPYGEALLARLVRRGASQRRPSTRVGRNRGGGTPARITAATS